MKVINIENSANKFRARRFSIFKEIVEKVVHEKGSCVILDVGGTALFWETFGKELDWNVTEVYLLNLFESPSDNPKIKSIVGDGRDLSALDGLRMDIAHSNSVLEHVGCWDDMKKMAKEVRRIAPHYFIQTPYFWFPFEPHARFPIFHWLPEPLRCHILMKRACGYFPKAKDIEAAMTTIKSAVLLDKHQMNFLFPDAKLISEKAFGMTKSLMAVR